MNKKFIFGVVFVAMSLFVTHITLANNIPSHIQDFDTFIKGTITSVNRDSITITTTDQKIVEQVTEYLTEQRHLDQEKNPRDNPPASGRDRIIQMMNERRERERASEASSESDNEPSVSIKVLASQSQLRKNNYQIGDDIIIDGVYESLRNVIVAQKIFNQENIITRKSR